MRQLSMKTAPILVAIMALASFVRSQNAEPETAASSRPTVTPVVVPTTARTFIPHSLEVRSFTPAATTGGETPPRRPG